jgi:sporulation protein YlmC with PRC-barrel domain
MKRTVALLAAAAIATIGVSAPAFSQGSQQTVSLMRVDVKPLASGFRTTKIVGGEVVNEADEKIGRIDDLIVTENERVPFAIVSVGGFLGVGNKLIAVPFDAIEMGEKKMVLRGANKDALKSLPEFKYAK